MNGKEVREALIQGFPVTCGGQKYDFVSAIIYRCKDGKTITVSAEMMDVKGRSVSVADVGKIERAL